MIITGPLHPCPQCRQTALGTLNIRDNVHFRRCRICSHDEAKRLPPLKKKLVYLDQMVLSGIAKELDPVWRKKTRRGDGFWLEVFDRIDRLVKLQLIVCPRSPIHEMESSYDDRYEAVLRRLYEHLATGVRLRVHHEVLMTQLSEALDAWLACRDPDWSRVTCGEVVRGRLDSWSDRILVIAHLPHWLGRIGKRRESRDQGHEALKTLWKQWCLERHVAFVQRFEKERCGLAEAAFHAFETRRLVSSWPARLVTWLLDRLRKSGVPERAVRRKAESFLYSESALHAPQNHLSSLLVAALAWRAANGQRCPNRGTLNDINFISAYLPYCDAMFVDNEFAQLLSEGELAAAVEDYPTRIFSARSREEFLAYLDGLENDAEPAHVERVMRVYGSAWTKPFRSILEHERSGQLLP